MKKYLNLISLVVLLLSALAMTGCTQDQQEPVIVTQVVRETQIVTEQETVIETVEVQVVETVEILVTPEPGEEVQQKTDRKGGWLDEIIISVVAAESAPTQIKAGAIDIYTSGMPTPQDLEAIREAGLEYSTQYGTNYELRFNPVGPTFEGTGELNPFYSARIREALNWLVDREYLNQEIYGGASIPKWLPITAGFPDYALLVDVARELEARYPYDFERAKSVITEEMEALGAEMIDGKWHFEGEPVILIFLIRTDHDGTRRPIGDYVASQLEDVGFTVDRQYKTSSESTPIWVLGNPNDGQWHIYTGAWGVNSISRDQGWHFQFYYTPQSSYAFSPLWQAYDPPAEFIEISEALANNTFTSLDERREMFARGLELTFDFSYVVWLIDGKSFSPWRPGVEVTYDLGAGVDLCELWPYTLRFNNQEGGRMRLGQPDLFVDPWNPLAGSNWATDSSPQKAIGDNGTIPDPFTGIPLPKRIERAEVTVLEGLPVTATYDWVTLDFAPEIPVPTDAWADWDAEKQVFITAGEKFPEGTTAKRRSVVYYPEDFLETVKWHDGSPISAADFVMAIIMTLDPGKEGSPIYDSSFAAPVESTLSTWKGVRILSQDPLIIEYYSDTWYIDAEYNVATFWPDYGQGDAPWHSMAVSNLADANGELAYSAVKADELEIEQISFIGGPALEILDNYLDQAMMENYIPYAATMSQYVSPEQAASRYANLDNWYAQHEHFWLGTGPYYLDQVFLLEKTISLKHNLEYPDPSDQWDIFAQPKLAEILVDGPGRVLIGEEASFDIYIDFEEQPYPLDEISTVKYLFYDETGGIAFVADAEAVEDGHYRIVLSAEESVALKEGSHKLEIAVVTIPVSIPSFTTFDFVVSP